MPQDRLKIALYDTGTLGARKGSDDTRELVCALARIGHDVALICSEARPDLHRFINRAVEHRVDRSPLELFSRDRGLPGEVCLHRLPESPQITRAEIVNALSTAIEIERPDVVQGNHLVDASSILADACSAGKVPYYLVPGGGAIVNRIDRDERILAAVRRGLVASDGIVWISRELRDRVGELFPELHHAIEAKSHPCGIGIDTSLFTPMNAAARPFAWAALKRMHVRGGKSRAQRSQLKRQLDLGRVEATTAYRRAYDRTLPDDDLPELLDRIPVESELILYAGELRYEKGIHALITAMPGIIASRPAAHLVVIGSGGAREILEAMIHSLSSGNERLFDELVYRGQDLESPELRGALEDVRLYAMRPDNRRRLFALGERLADQVHLLGEFDRSRLRWIYPYCRLAVVPSIGWEASPRPLFEALANGVLPLGSDHSALREGLDDLRGQLPDNLWSQMKLPVEPALRVQGLVDRVSRLCDRAHDTLPASRLRQIAESRHDWNAVARQIAAIARLTSRKKTEAREGVPV